MTTTALLAALLVVAQTPAPAAPPEMAVPFGCGLSFPVSQAHNTGSHLDNDVWAWDFRMPEGIPITAAGDGVVRMARGDSNIGGCDEQFAPYANYVVISHGNGYETQYLHFSRVVVHAGDHVKAGDLLGYSGKTGWACGSHLHFKVTVAGESWNNRSVPARIVGYGDPQVATLIVAPACKKPQIQMASAGPADRATPTPPVASAQTAQGASGAQVTPASVPVAPSRALDAAPGSAKPEIAPAAPVPAPTTAVRTTT